VIAQLRHLRRELLGLNRRNHAFMFGYNPRHRYRLADDKVATKALLAQHGIPSPVTHASCAAHWDVERVGTLLRALPACVLKPARGAGGAGIVVLTRREGDGFVAPTGHRWSWAQLATHIVDILGGVFASGGFADTLLVEALVQCEPGLARLAYRGVPDVRVLVFRGLPLLAMLRLPTRASNGRANLHVGGIGVGIDLAHGITTTAVCRGRRTVRHPDLACDLAGVPVPAWEEILRLAARTAAAADLGFAGVDLVVDAGRGPLVLELNARPGLAIQAANGQGLRRLLAAASGIAVPAETDARVRLGQWLAATNRSGTAGPL
jgi:alpha-L-glutamate ligase-like protein